MTDAELDRIMGILGNLKGVGKPMLLLSQGDLGMSFEHEFGQWLETPKGQFAQYEARHSDTAA